MKLKFSLFFKLYYAEVNGSLKINKRTGPGDIFSFVYQYAVYT